MTPDQRLSLALTRRLHANGAIGDDDVYAMAAEIEAEGDAETAHLVRCIAVRAHEPRPSDWNAERARARMTLVDGGKE